MIFCACSNMLVSCVLQPSELAKALAARAAKITKSKFALMDMLTKSNRKDARSQARMATKNRDIKPFPMLFGSVGDKMDQHEVPRTYVLRSTFADRPIEREMLHVYNNNN